MENKLQCHEYTTCLHCPEFDSCVLEITDDHDSIELIPYELTKSERLNNKQSFVDFHNECIANNT